MGGAIEASGLGTALNVVRSSLTECHSIGPGGSILAYDEASLTIFSSTIHFSLSQVHPVILCLSDLNVLTLCWFHVVVSMRKSIDSVQ